MPKNPAKRAELYAYTQDRELSWLRFNQRVLEEARDRTVPPFERLRFIAIFSSNLDEFFMVRVGSLFDVSIMSPDEIDNKTGQTPSEQLTKIYNAIPGLVELKRQIYASVLSDLRECGIVDTDYAGLHADEQKFVNQFFRQKICPIISPIIIGSHHPVPHLASKHLYIAARLQDKKGKTAVGLVPMPQSLPELIHLPDTHLRFIRTERVLQHWAPTLFGSYQVTESCVLCVTRNADLSFDEDKFDDSDDDFRSRVANLLKKRGSLSIMRLEIDRKISDDFAELIQKTVQVGKRQTYIDTCPLNMNYVNQLAELLAPTEAQALLYTPYVPRWPEDIDPAAPMIEQIQQKDKLLFYPYDSIDPFLKLLSEAAERPDVLSIKITIYRLASSSKIARILCRAAENGKEVVVLMELRARFDEANNIAWSKVLEEAGCQVIYGMDGFKCHSKICLVTMHSRGKLHFITQIGTGNYNEKTTAMYTDLSLMTASEAIGRDGTLFFQNMLVNNLDGLYEHLLVAPAGIKPDLCRLIDAEIAKGTDGYICIKANSVTERDIIDKLSEASKAGVEIQLIIRGICCILPGVPLSTDNIHVTSIVGRFLEHARIYMFGKGPDPITYISSADLMTRNLNRRVEIACPVYDPAIKEQLQWILATQLRDTAKASFMMSDGLYHRKVQSAPGACDSQMQFMEQSCHKKAYARLPRKTALQRLTASLQAWFHPGRKP